jgi:hypothetical protein
MWNGSVVDLCVAYRLHLMSEVDRPGEAPIDQASLPSDVQARWDALADATRQMASATDDAEGFRAAWAAMAQAARGFDYRQMLDTMHIPEDAGEHAEALAAMLRRIPDGWGRWIRCGRGWYPLVVELDEQLRQLLPDYVIHQVKEKFGCLRFYWGSSEDVHDPRDPEPSPPRSGTSDAEREAWVQQREAWSERLDAYQQTPEGQKRVADLERRRELAEQLVGTAEWRAAVTCELCGARGEMHCRKSSAWYMTLCPACAEREDYMLVRESDPL